MQLVMFDIDGTLTQSNSLDNATFLQALSEVFGFSEVSDDWSAFTHVTDSCILREVCETRLGRVPSDGEVQQFRSRFITLLSLAIANSGGIKPIPGASSILTRLRSSSDFAVAYAGGAWTDSALLKLRSAGLPHYGIPYAFADDAYSREDICTIALGRAEVQYQRKFSRVIYIGDGVWDVRAARKMGYAFMGIVHDCDPNLLFVEGARRVLPDFQDIDQFISLLHEALD